MSNGPDCPYCQGKSVQVSGEYIYPHRPDLYTKKFFMCIPCEAYVGVHAATGEPLGKLANAYLRRKRSAAHAAFDPVWQQAAGNAQLRDHQANKTKKKGQKKPVLPIREYVKVQRAAAYARLAKLMDISVENCHIGCFDAIQCQRVIDLCNSREIYRSQG